MAHPKNFRSNHPSIFMAAMLAASCVAQAFFLAAPGYVDLMGRHWGYAEAQLGASVTAAVGSATAGALLAAFVLSGWPVRSTFALSLAALLAGGLLMVGNPAYPGALLQLALAGLGGGVISGIAMRYLGEGSHATRNYAWLITVQSLTSLALLSFALPVLDSPERAFLLIAIAAAGCLPMLMLFDRQEPLIDEGDAKAMEGSRSGAHLSLLSIFALYLGIGVVWTYIEHYGVSVGLPHDTVAVIVGLGTIGSLVGCLAASLGMARGWRVRCAVASLLCCAVTSVLLALPQTKWLYICATVGFLFAWNAAATLLLATISLYDPVGRQVASAPGFLGFGYCAGSMLGGEVIEAASPCAAFLMAAAACVVAAGFYVALRFVPFVPGEGGTSTASTSSRP